MRRVLSLLVSGLWCLGVLAVPASGSVIAAVGDLGCSPKDTAYNNGYGLAGSAQDPPLTHLCRSKYVAGLLPTINGGSPPDAFLPLGDNQYYLSSDPSYSSDFNSVYANTFGGVTTDPVLGNAEYGLDGTPPPGASGATDFATLFPGKPTTGYYSYDISGWHIIALNSNCEEYNVCNATTQEAWLASDLAAHANQCTLAYFHHARWNSGGLGNDAKLATIWSELYASGVDVVLNGHSNHHYERFNPQNPNGVADPIEGIREFIVSTGGQSHGGSGTIQPNSAVRDYTTFGVLKMTLNSTSYTWQFVSEPSTESLPGVSPFSSGFSDSGSGTCHSATAKVPAVPTLAAAAGQTGSVLLSWSPPAGAPPTADGGAPITGYNLYRSTTTGTETLVHKVTAATLGGAVPTTYSDTGLTNGVKYYYKIAAVNYVGAGTQTAELSGVALAPGSVQNTSPPIITGTAKTGQTLTALPGIWTTTAGGSPGTTTFTYQWCHPVSGPPASCTTIPGATANTYAPTGSDLNQTLAVTVTAKNNVNTLSVTAAATAPVALGPPLNTTSPSVVGTAQESHTVTCNTGTWQQWGTAASFAVTWLRGGHTVATGTTTYTLHGADVAAMVSCSVVGSNLAGSSPVAVSTAVAVTPLAPASVSPPQINGIAQVGHSLSCANGSWAHFPKTFILAWLRNGSPIGNSSSSYRVARRDVGQSITCQVEAVNITGTATASSPIVTPVNGSDITITASPSRPTGLVGVAWPHSVTVSGIVTQDDGQPAPHARIQFKLETLAGAPINVVKTITTGRDGRYRAAILPGRNGLLIAHVEGSPLVAPVDAPPIQVSVTPGISKLHAARNKHSRIVISGRVLITSPTNAVIVRITANGKTIAKARPDARGRFSITLPASVAGQHRFVVHLDPKHPGMLNGVRKLLRI